MSTFQFIKRLGSGYFGEVWLVNDTGLNAQFALKLVPRDKVINTSNFYQEAQILKAAEHSNIVKVAETGEMADGRIYVKMEYLHNGSLEDESSGAYVAITRVKKIMIDVLRGLEHAHSKKIIHRDIKPANILIGNSKEGKLSDFGLALPDFKKVDVSTLKKYQYWMHLAPEVDNLTDYDFLSDLYSCGVTLYRMVNGDAYLPTIAGDTLRTAIKSGIFPDRTKYREFIPLTMRKLINKALSVNPGERYVSAKAMRHALEQVKVHINWTETDLMDGKRWRTSHNNEIIEVSRMINSKGTYDVEVKKGKKIDQLRRINRLCFENISELKAVQYCKKALQAYVTGQE